MVVGVGQLSDDELLAKIPKSSKIGKIIDSIHRSSDASRGRYKVLLSALS